MNSSTNLVHYLLKEIVLAYITKFFPKEYTDLGKNKNAVLIAFIIQNIQEKFRKLIWLPRNEAFHNEIKTQNMTLKQLIKDAKEQHIKSLRVDKRKRSAADDDLSYNVWNGFPNNNHLDISRDKDHLNRSMMDRSDRNEWTS